MRGIRRGAVVKSGAPGPGALRHVMSGKVKDVYEHGDDLLFEFSDRVSAFDVPFAERIPGKGESLCSFAQFWFENLPVESHFVRRVSERRMLVRKLDMVPVECVVRGYLYGSLAERCKRGLAELPPGSSGELASKLPAPVFDPTTKAEHDEPITKKEAVESGLVSEGTFGLLESESLRIYGHLGRLCAKAGFIAADLKLEFGTDARGKLVLADSIGPDEFRLWPADLYEPGRIQESYDKQVLRDWLVSEGHAARFEAERAAGRVPAPPAIPPWLVSKMAGRYSEAYSRICA